MPNYEIFLSAFITAEFEQEPSEDEVIAQLREDPNQLLLNLEVDSIDEEE